MRAGELIRDGYIEGQYSFPDRFPRSTEIDYTFGCFFFCASL